MKRGDMMDVFMVKFTLASPVAITSWKHTPLTLDGLLFACLSRIVSGGAPGRLPLPAEEIRDLIPLDREKNDGKYVFACSLPYVRDRLYSVSAVAKTLDWTMCSGVRRLYTKGDMKERQGPYQMMREYFSCAALSDVRFYARGDAERVAEIFSNAKIKKMGLGRFRRIGFGRIANVEISLVKPSQDFSVFGPDGLPTRPVPSSWVNMPGVPRIAASILPPYWSTESTTLCAMPDPEVWFWN